MKNLHCALIAIAASVLLAGCATTDTEPTKQEKDRMAREQQRANQKQAQSQDKMMRDSGLGSQRKGSR